MRELASPPQPHAASPRDAVDAALQDAAPSIRQVEELLGFYEREKRKTRWLFRASSLLVIALSLSMPFLSTQPAPWSTGVLPVVSVLVALLTAVAGFYRWGESWRDFAVAAEAIKYHRACWELAIAEARHGDTAAQAGEAALAATRRLVDDVYRVVNEETQSFFGRVRAPSREEPGRRAPARDEGVAS